MLVAALSRTVGKGERSGPGAAREGKPPTESLESQPGAGGDTALRQRQCWPVLDGDWWK